MLIGRLRHRHQYITVFILLLIAKLMITLMWRLNINPDNSAIPLLTAFGDLLGIGLLTIGFKILYG